MSIVHEQKSYWAIKKKLTARHEEFFSTWVQLTTILTKFWAPLLTPAELQTILFIAGRTLLFHKKAEAITRVHFMDGVTDADNDRVCFGCGLSENTLRKALKGLEDKGFLVVHVFLKGKSESMPRIYEVDCEKIIQNLPNSVASTMLKRPKPKKNNREIEEKDGLDLAEIGLQNRQYNPPQILRDPPANFEGHNIYKYNYRESSIEDSSAGAPTAKGSRVRRSKRSIAIDCKPDTVVPEKARARLQALSEERSATKSARLRGANSVPTHKWSQKELQAILDEARARCGITIPRIVVTAKPIGTLHKRMISAGVEDPMEFFTWAMRSWNKVANANRKAKARKMRDTKTSDTEMSLSPNFNDLSYRFPYIVAFFNDRQMADALEEQDRKEAKASREGAKVLQRIAIDERKRIVADLDRQRDTERRRQDQEDKEFFKRLSGRAKSVDSFEDDSEIPQWREREWRDNQ